MTPENEMQFQKYIDVEGRRAEPVIRGRGFPVWSVVGYYLACGKDKHRVLMDYKGELSENELEAALAYYESHVEQIDQKLAALSS